MQRVEQKLENWKAIWKQAAEARAKLREALEQSDLDKIDRYAAEAKRLGEASDRAHAELLAVLSARLKS